MITGDVASEAARPKARAHSIGSSPPAFATSLTPVLSSRGNALRPTTITLAYRSDSSSSGNKCEPIRPVAPASKAVLRMKKERVRTEKLPSFFKEGMFEPRARTGVVEPLNDTRTTC